MGRIILTQALHFARATNDFHGVSSRSTPLDEVVDSANGVATALVASQHFHSALSPWLAAQGTKNRVSFRILSLLLRAPTFPFAREIYCDTRHFGHDASAPEPKDPTKAAAVIFFKRFVGPTVAELPARCFQLVHITMLFGGPSINWLLSNAVTGSAAQQSKFFEDISKLGASLESLELDSLNSLGKAVRKLVIAAFCKNLPNLREFTCKSMDSSTAELQQMLTAMPHLRRLTVHNTDAEPSKMIYPTGLQQLDLHSMEEHNGSGAWKALLPLESLADLSVAWDSSHKAVKAALMSKQGGEQNNDSSLPALFSLRKLHLDCVEDMDGRTLEVLVAAAPNLEHLKVEYSLNNNLDDQMPPQNELDSIAKLQFLRYLFVEDSQVNDVSALGQLSQLQELILKDMNFLDATTLVPVLQSNKESLRTIEFEGLNVIAEDEEQRKESVAAVFGAVCALPRLESFKFDEDDTYSGDTRPIPTDVVAPLLQGMLCRGTLRVLQFVFGGVDRALMAALASAPLPQLEELTVMIGFDSNAREVDFAALCVAAPLLHTLEIKTGDRDEALDQYKMLKGSDSDSDDDDDDDDDDVEKKTKKNKKDDDDDDAAAMEAPGLDHQVEQFIDNVLAASPHRRWRSLAFEAPAMTLAQMKKTLELPQCAALMVVEFAHELDEATKHEKEFPNKKKDVRDGFWAVRPGCAVRVSNWVNLTEPTEETSDEDEDDDDDANDDTVSE